MCKNVGSLDTKAIFSLMNTRNNILIISIYVDMGQEGGLAKVK